MAQTRQSKPNRGKKLKSLIDFKPDPEKDDVHRAAEFLDLAAQQFPMRAVPITYIVRVANMCTRLPQEASKQVEIFKKLRMQPLKRVLYNEYQRALIYKPGFGYRATVDSEDIVKTDLEIKSRRVVNAIDGLQRSKELVDPKTIKTKSVKTRFNEISRTQKLLTAEVRQKLLPSGDD
jgi:hypothetical protein